MHGHVSSVNELVRNGANVEFKYFPGSTPLVYAALLNRTNVVKALIEDHNAQINARDLMVGQPCITLRCKAM